MLVATPCGRTAFSPGARALDMFVDLAAPQHSQESTQAASGAAGDPSTRNSGETSVVGLEEPTAASTAESSTAASADTAGSANDHCQQTSNGYAPVPLALPLLDVCRQAECWGLLGVDLCSGEAVFYEADGCKLQLAPGAKVVAWQNTHEQQDQATDQDKQANKASEASPSTAMPALQAAESVDSSQVIAVIAAQPAATASSRDGHVPEDNKGDHESGDDLSDDNDLDYAETAARQAAAAAAAAKAAVEAAAASDAAEAAAAAAAAAAEAARVLPLPVAQGIEPRLFVIDPTTQRGFEVLDIGAVTGYAQKMAALPGHRHEQQPVKNAAEPGSICHTYMTSYRYKSPQLQPLPLAEPSVAMPWAVDSNSSLVSLRRTDVFVPPALQPSKGLKLPRIAALNPQYLSSLKAGAASSIVGASASGSAGHLLATRLTGILHYAAPLPANGAVAIASAAPAATATGQVIVVREILELPELSLEMQQTIQNILAAYKQHQESQEVTLAARLPPSDPRSNELKQQAAEIEAMLREACETVSMPTTSAGGDASNSTGSSSNRLNDIRHRLQDEAAAAAAASAARAAEAAQQIAAAEAAAKRKPYKPWVKKVGPFDHTPQRPEPGKTLKYFEAQEGLLAMAVDPLLHPGTKIIRQDLPPGKPVTSASAGGLICTSRNRAK
eukprot:GHRR01036579.1.p1 GENE.GHRR01036579.1~~GHRR01036579.1.p1  ORF type:complete len:671 (+),score=295.85 GHRR01036579.1:383-2395(+)